MDVVAKDSMPADPGTAFPIVGVGASAGGIEALSKLLGALPERTGMGFVIVQHLAPGRASNLAEILSRATRMPVCEVRDEPAVEPEHVYVIPPARDMVIGGGKLQLLPQERRPRHRGIDQFFRSLADDRGHQAIGVVLSGSASDGTDGLETIKAAGGITFAQDESAQHESMPRSAIASGCVDFVLPPEEIAREIARIARHPYVAREEETAPGPEHARIAQIVRRAKGVDFTHYKANTLSRRITRRMLLHKLDTLREYEEHLRRTPEEIEALYQDVLISVTSFFRNPEAFDALAEKVFSKLLAERTSHEPVRVWTLGCSTGEEAYSLAMAFMESAEAAGSRARVQIFATDLNGTGIEKARAGLYTRSIAQDVSPARLKRFFVEEEGGYRIAKAVRERCVFSRHNVLTDPPFSRVDLISCRNLLIYLEPVLQQYIFPLLHYALKPGGFLWLGSSEAVGSYGALFEVVDPRQKIFVRRPGPPAARRPLLTSVTAPDEGLSPLPPRKKAPAEWNREVERVLLAKYAPPGVVVSTTMEILQFRGDTGAYLAPAAGPPSVQLLKMLREGLLTGVRAAIQRAGEEKRPVREEGLRVKSGHGFREVAIEVIPFSSGAASESGFVVLFDEGTRATPTGPPPVPPAASEARNDEIVRLTQELAATRQYLESVVENHEAANEELQSANEEAQSANEEMQSINEELESSKEEIQSSNEELATVNDELHHRNVELNRLNDQLQRARDYAENIAANVRVPLLVLDGTLRVKTVSQAFYECFHVTPETTIGRRIYEIGTGQWDIPELQTLLEDVLPRDSTIDAFEVRHPFEDIGSRIMLVRARRLARLAGEETLIVLSVEDITERTQAEAALRESEERYRALFDSMNEGFCIIEVLFDDQKKPADYRFLEVNPVFEKHTGMQDAKGKRLRELVPANEKNWFEIFDRISRLRDPAHFECHVDSLGRWFEVSVAPLDPAESGRLGIVINDITERRHSAEKLREHQARFDLVKDAAQVGFWFCDLPFDTLKWDARVKEHFWLSPEANVTIDTFYERLHPDDRERVRQAIAEAIAKKTLYDTEYRTVSVDGREKWVRAVGRAFYDDDGKPIRFDGVTLDNSERKRGEEALVARAEELAQADRSKDEFLAMLAHELRNPLAPLRNAAEILRASGGNAEETAQALSVLDRQIVNMTRMVDDLLDVSRITQGKIELRREPVALGAIVTAAANLMRLDIAKRGQKLRIVLPADPVYLDADATRLEQVFGNLLSNACKYSADGGEIFLTAERVMGGEPPEVIVRVRDEGVGIAPELLPRVFDLFVQASRALDRTQGGLGIGLTLVRRLVTLHGGSVEARSAGLGLGSVFIVRLPILREAPPLPSPSPSPSVGRTTPRRILIVDDNVDSAKSMAMLQRRRGHETRTAFTGPDAVAAAAEFRPDFVLLDIGLPDMDGFEVARQLRAMPELAGAFLVALTGYASDEDLAVARQAGFDEYMVKPADLGRLREWLQNRV